MKIIRFMVNLFLMKVDFFKIEDKKRGVRLSIMRAESIEILKDAVENQITVIISNAKNIDTPDEYQNIQVMTVCFTEDLYNWNIKNSPEDN